MRQQARFAEIVSIETEGRIDQETKPVDRLAGRDFWIRSVPPSVLLAEAQRTFTLRTRESSMPLGEPTSDWAQS